MEPLLWYFLPTVCWKVITHCNPRRTIVVFRMFPGQLVKNSRFFASTSRLSHSRFSFQFGKFLPVNESNFIPNLMLILVMEYDSSHGDRLYALRTLLVIENDSGHRERLYALRTVLVMENDCMHSERFCSWRRFLFMENNPSNLWINLYLKGKSCCQKNAFFSISTTPS